MCSSWFAQLLLLLGSTNITRLYNRTSLLCTKIQGSVVSKRLFFPRCYFTAADFIELKAYMDSNWFVQLLLMRVTWTKAHLYSCLFSIALHNKPVYQRLRLNGSGLNNNLVWLSASHSLQPASFVLETAGWVREWLRRLGWQGGLTGETTGGLTGGMMGDRRVLSVMQIDTQWDSRRNESFVFHSSLEYYMLIPRLHRCASSP